jgi:ribosomal protein S18 acetylase RimI-like enzyme
MLVFRLGGGMRQLFITDKDAFSRYWMDLRHGIRTRGWKRGVRLIVNLARWDDLLYFDRLRVFSQPVPEEPVTKSPRVPITFRLATEADIPLYEQIHKWPSILREDARMIRRGDLAMLALDGDRLVGQQMAGIWTETRKSAQVIGTALAHAFPIVPHEDAYLDKLWVSPDYRGKNIATPLGLHLLNALHERGVRRIYTVVPVKNIASLWTSWSIGSQVIGEMAVYQIANWLYIRVTPAKDTAHPQS